MFLFLVRICLCFAISLPFAAVAEDYFGKLKSAIQQGDWEKAKNVARLLDSKQKQGDFYLIYVDAVRFVFGKRCAEASILSKTLLQANPNFIPARELLIICQLRGKDHVAARKELSNLLALLPEGPQRTLIEQQLDSIKASKSLRFSLYAEVKPSSNINRQTDNTNIGALTITEESRGKKGTKLTVGGAVIFPISEGEERASYGRLKIDMSRDNVEKVVKPSLTAEVITRFGNAAIHSFSFTPFATIGFEKDEHDYHRYGAYASYFSKITQNRSIGWNIAAYKTEYQQSSVWDSLELINSFEYAVLLQPRTRLSANLGMDNYLRENRARRYTSGWVGSRLDHLFKNGLITAVQGKIGQRKYSDAAPPTIGNRQRDKFHSARVEFSHKKFVLGPFFGTSVRPVLYYEYTQQDSNNVFYEYKSHDVALIMRTSF